MKSKEQILEEIQPAVEKACSYIIKRLENALIQYYAYKTMEQEELGVREMVASIKSMGKELVEILQKPEFPKPIYSIDLKILTHEEMEDKRLVRSYFMEAVANNLYFAAKKTDGGFSNFLEDLGQKIATDPKFMFPDLPACSID